MSGVRTDRLQVAALGPLNMQTFSLGIRSWLADGVFLLTRFLAHSGWE